MVSLWGISYLKGQAGQEAAPFPLLCFLSLLHHFLHLRKLLEKAVYILDAGAAALGDAPLAAVLDEHFRVRTCPFLGGHGRDNRFNALELLAVHVDFVEFFFILANAGNEAHETAHISHFLDHLQLAEEIIEGKAAALHGLFHVGHGFFVEGGLSPFDNRFYVA